MKRPARPFVRTLALGLASFALCTSVLADPVAASRYYEDGLKRFEAQDVAGAIIQLKNALQQDRNMLAAHLLLARAYFSEGDIGPAEVEFREALRLGVSRAEVAVPLGRIYLLQGRPGKLIESVPADGLPAGIRLEVLTQRGIAYAALDKRNDAERSFADARAIDPSSPVPLVAEVPMLISSGRLGLARERAVEAVQLGPAHAGAYNARGSVTHAAGDVAAALQDYERAIELQPSLVDARIARAGILIDLGRDAEARADLEQLAEGGPVEPRASYLLALLASRRGEGAEAARHFAEAAGLVDALPIEWLSGHEQLLMVGGLAHHAGRQYEKARKYLETLTARYPRNLGARKLLASIHVETGDHARATGLLEQVLRVQPDDPQATYLLGRVHLAQKRYAKATELLEKAARTGESRAQAALGFSRLAAGDTPAATRDLLAAFDKVPGDLGLAITLSNTLMREGNGSKALDVAQRANSALPGNPAALNLLGAVKGASGDLAGARAAYAEALRRDAGFTPARLNQARLDVAEGRFDDARLAYGELLQKNKRDTTAMYESALLEQRAGRPAEALRWLEKAAAERPGDVRIGLALIQAKGRAGDRQGALEAAKALSARHSGDLPVLGALAEAQIEVGDARAAQHTLREMVKFAEFDTAALVRIGYLQIAGGHPTDAAYAAQKALQGTPGDRAALVLAAEAALVAGTPDAAAQAVAELRNRHPASPDGLRLAGDLAMAGGQHAVAADAYRQAFDMQPSTPLLLRHVQVLMAQGKPAAGVTLLRGWLQAGEEDVEARKALAELHMHMSDWAAARGEYEKLVAAGAGDAMVMNNLANALLGLKDPKALEVAQAAVALNASSPLVLDTLGWALAQAGRTDEAIGALRDARLRDPSNAEIRYHLASVLASKGRQDEARVELRAALEAVGVAGMPAEAKPLLVELGL